MIRAPKKMQLLTCIPRRKSSNLWKGSQEWRGSSLALVTNLEHKEIKDLHTIYEKLSLSSTNGRCSLEDITNSLGNSASREGVSKVFHIFDDEKNGTCDLKRFLVGISACCKGSPKERLQFCLAIYSSDHKNIDGDSLSKIINSMLKILEIHSAFFTSMGDTGDRPLEKRMSVVSWTLPPGIEDVNEHEKIDIAEWISERMLVETECIGSRVVPLETACHWLCHNSTSLQFLNRMERLSKFDLEPKPQTVEEERSIVQTLMKKGSKLRMGETRCVISYKWWKLWAEYVNFYGDISSKKQSSDNPNLPNLHPGVIDNSELVEGEINPVIGALMKQNIVENLDFIIIAQSVWDELCSWYGGGPILRRTVISDKKPRRLSMIESIHKEKSENVRYSAVVELYPLLLSLQTEYPLSAENELHSVVCSKLATVMKLKDLALSELQIPRTLKSRMWILFENQEPELLSNYEQTLEDAKVFHKYRIYIETMVNGKWILEIKQPKHDGPEIDKNYKGDGLVGLTNLGNTCFMNSALQCMSHTLALREYFLSELYMKDINVQNPLGMRGEIAKEFGSLLKRLWSTKSPPSVAPKSFKTCIGKFAPQFSGYDQQDAQELLGFLLDGLHEDLNRVIKKPYIELKDPGDRSEEEIASEYWENHVKRNQSVIVSLFQGQLKSVVTCAVCNHKSYHFDPFTFLSLPLPNIRKRMYEVTVIFRSGRQINFSCPVSHRATFRELKLSLIQVIPAKVHPEQLAFFDVTDNYIFSIIRENKSVQEYSDIEKFQCYEVIKVKTPTAYGFISLMNRFIKANEDDSDILRPFVSHLEPFPLPLQTPKCSKNIDIYKAVFARVKAYFAKKSTLLNDVSEDDPETYPFILKHVNRNGTSCGQCNWADSCLGCVLEPLDEEFTLDVNASLALDWKCSPSTLKFSPVEDYRTLCKQESGGLAASLQDCLREFSKEEILEGEAFHCSKCKELRSALKTMELWQVPPILVVHLKRFQIDGRGRTSKVNSLITFDINNFDLKPFLLSHKNYEHNSMYDLYAIVSHFGSISGGHYVSYCYNETLSKWVCFDDSNYSEVKETQLSSKATYLLFYKVRIIQLYFILAFTVY